MPSDRRLHPLSILFGIIRQFGAMVVPLVLIIIGRGTDEDWWNVYALILIVPFAGIAVARYLSFRYRYEEGDLVIRRGLLFRNQRHIPYDRIQNIDAVQNVLHRLTGVVEVRVQTGSGNEPEATLSVLALSDLDEMRRRVFLAARPRATEAGTVEATPVVAPQVLVRLGPGDLALYGIIENRGLLVIAALLGVLTEFGPASRFLERLLGDQASRGVLRRTGRALLAGGLSMRVILYGLAGLALFLLVSRVFSIGWALVRLHGYTLVKVGEDLRAEYGLFTRVTATIPRRRIQCVTVRDTPLHRLLGCASVRVATAGGMAAESEKAPQHREWLAPIMRRSDVPGLLAILLPGIEVSSIDWRGVHPRAFRRAMNRGLATMVLPGTLVMVGLGAAGFWVLPFLALWALVRARIYIAHLAWAITTDVAAAREGAFVRTMSIAPLAKIQTVARLESPFDRRTEMARVRADTAGRGGDIDVPYLPAATAHDFYCRLANAAAGTAFRW